MYYKPTPLLLWSALGVGAYGILARRPIVALLGFGAIAYAVLHDRSGTIKSFESPFFAAAAAAAASSPPTATPAQASINAAYSSIINPGPNPACPGCSN